MPTASPPSPTVAPPARVPAPGGDGATLWARFGAAAGPAPAAARVPSAAVPPASARAYRWVVGAALPFALLVAAGLGVLLPASLATSARLALFAFAVAVVLWSTTSLNTAYVALGTVLLAVVTGAAPQERLFDALASDVVWLMIGAFVLGEAVERSGLAARLTNLVVGRSRTVGGTCWLLAGVLAPLAFVIPSTSGRAAVILPVFRSIAAVAEDRRVTRAVALLLPAVILVTTMMSLVGAGSHLVANDLLAQVAGRPISFARWALYGVPFGLAAGAVTTFAVLRIFLTGDQRDRRLVVAARPARPLGRAEWTTLAAVVVMLALWLTERVHGLEIATVAVAGAVVLTTPRVGVLTWKDGLKAVSWNLVLFVGAALVLGRALVDTGAARWIIDGVFAAVGLDRAGSHLLLLAGLAFVTLTSHAYMTSHAARAAALVPPLLYVAGSLKLSAAAVMFIGTVGMDYCLTFPVSSKALLMFQELDGETFEPSDLLRLSAVLLPVHLVLIVAFYYGYWRWVGLAL